MTGPDVDTGPDWSVSAQRVAARAWEWLAAAQEHFALPVGVAVADLKPNRHVQPLTELALCGSIAVREGAGGSRETRIASDLVEFAWAQLGAGELLHEMQNERGLYDTLALESYSPFVRAGYRHQRLEALLCHLAGLRGAGNPEVVPDRALGLINSRRLVGIAEPRHHAELIARTWLGAIPEPWAADLASLYAMTHTVFHLTDWGASPDGLPGDLQDYLHTWLPAWLEVYLEIGHWDIVGEMLIVDLCLTEPDHPAAAWDSLRAAQQPDGLIPAEPGRVIDHGAKAVRSHYHSTIVGAVAGTLGVARRLERPGTR